MFFFFFKQKTAYEMLRSLVGSEMCIRDRDKYVRALASKSVDCEQVETEQIWDQMKKAIFSSAKEVCGCAKVGNKNVNSEWWNEEVMLAVKSKKEAWLNVLKANDEVSKERCLELYK